MRERLKWEQWEPGIAQWWEHSPPTNVARVRFPVSVSYVGWVCCWFSSLLRGFFSGYSGFPPSTKTNISKFQFYLETVDRRATPWIPLKFLFILFYLFYFNCAACDISLRKPTQRVIWKVILNITPVRRNDDPATLLAFPAIRTKKTLADRSFSCAAPRLWNLLPTTIRSISSLLRYF